MSTVSATVWASTMTTTMRAARDRVMRNVSEAVLVWVEQGIQREMRMAVVPQAVMTQRIQVVMPQAVLWVYAQRIAVMVGAISALGSKAGSRGCEVLRNERILLAGVNDERHRGGDKQ